MIVAGEYVETTAQNQMSPDGLMDAFPTEDRCPRPPYRSVKTKVCPVDCPTPFSPA